MYFTGLSQRCNQRTANYPDSTNSRHDHSTDMCSSNRQCYIERLTCRHLDDQSGQYLRNRINHDLIRSCRRNIQLHSDQCFRMYLTGLSQCCNQCTADNPDSTNSRNNHPTDLYSNHRQCCIERLTGRPPGQSTRAAYPVQVPQRPYQVLQQEPIIIQ